MSNPSLNSARDGDSRTSLSSPFQYLMTLPAKKFLLMSNLNFPWHTLTLCSLVLSLAGEEADPRLVTASFQTVESDKVSLSLLLSRLNNTSSLSHSSQGLCFQPSTSLVALLWMPSSISIILPVLGDPELDAALKEQPNQCHVHTTASGKIECYKAPLKFTLKAMGGGTFKHWDLHLAKPTWLLNTQGSTEQAGSAHSKPPCTVEGDKIPMVHIENVLGKTVWISLASSKGKPICGIVFAQGPAGTWWVMQRDRETRCIPPGN